MTPQQIKQLRYGHVEPYMTGSREYPTNKADCITCVGPNLNSPQCKLCTIHNKPKTSKS